jgi:hypothetical protein
MNLFLMLGIIHFKLSVVNPPVLLMQLIWRQEADNFHLSVANSETLLSIAAS